LIFWRYGILAAPVIGINLIGKVEMHSTSFHYDDVPSTMLFIGMILAVKELKERYDWENRVYQKKIQWLLVSWMGAILMLIPASPVRSLRKSIPTEGHWKIHEELRQFDEISQGKAIAVQSSLGPHFHRNNIRTFMHHKGINCAEYNGDRRANFPIQYAVLAPGLGHYKIDDMKQCLSDLSQSQNYRKLTEYQTLHVYENLRME
jgi:hypothetical protein